MAASRPSPVLTFPAVPATRRRITDADVRAADALRRAVTNTIDAAVLSYTPDFELTFANHAAAALSGYSVSELLARPDLWFSRIHPEDLEARDAALAELIATDQARYDYRLLRADGTPRWIHERLCTVRDVAHDPVRVDAVAIDITPRMAREEGLRETLAHATQFRHVFEISTVLGAVADFDGCLELVSPGWRTVMGYAPDRLVGARLLELVHPDDATETAEHLLSLMTSGLEGRTFEARFRCRDGSYRWLFWNMGVDPAQRRMHGVAHDVTERRLMDQALRASEERLRALTGQVPGCIYQFRQRHDGRGEFTYLSDGLTAIFGVEPEDVYADQGLLWSFIVPQDVEGVQASLAAATAALQPWMHDFHIALPSGETKGIHGHAHPHRTDDGTIEWSGLLTDVTELRRQEAELIRTREAALEASREKSRFLANMSHEIRTPMNGIIGMASLALSTPLSGEQREYLESVRTSAESLLGIINDILDISKIEARRMVIDAAPFGLRAMIDEAVTMSRPRALEKHLALDIRVDADMPARVVGDAVRVGQVVRNLVSNAVKFTDEGGVHIRVSREGPGRVRISVADSGPGIPPDQQAAIFEPFCQGDGSATRRFGGTGLGLSISRELVQLMQGALWVESEAGRGATFHCVLPLPDAPEEPAASLPPAPQPPAADEPLALHVLLVEDNPINSRVASRMLTRSGCTYDLAEDGLTALQMALENRYDVILMDLQMPGMDGLEVTRRIRAAEAGTAAHRRIVALTANAMKGDEDRCAEAGMDGYLSKPITIESLVREIRRATDA
ncbi:MAG: PAS domain-containing protein [Acidobacteriota bacterium]